MSLQGKKGAEKLLTRLVEEYNGGLPTEERIFKKKDIPAYIYNLYTGQESGKYKFSFEHFKELINLMNEKSLVEGIVS